ncbi:MAG: hypothetical protein HC767_07070 [Akkermansiaceae bacterium]|nr:hypothetical protein [Akkermansiaceae bacterium]
MVSITSERKPAFVEKAVCTFLDNMQGTLEALSEQAFSEHVQCVATMLLEAPHNIDEQVEAHWNTIWEMQYSFYDKYKVCCSHSSIRGVVVTGGILKTCPTW